MSANSTTNAEATVGIGGMLIATVVANDEAVQWVSTHAGTLALAFVAGCWIAFLACLFVAAGSYRIVAARILAGGTISSALTTVANLIGANGEVSFTLVVIIGGLAGGFLIKSGFLFAQEMQDKGQFRAAFAGMFGFWWRKVFGASLPLPSGSVTPTELDTPVLPSGKPGRGPVNDDKPEPGNG